jgi:polyhydroxyalkanoate synthase
MFEENRLVRGRLRLRDRRVDLRRIEQKLVTVTAGSDHITPPEGSFPILDLVRSKEVTHFARPGGHIGLMAGSKAKHETWPELADWLAGRSDRGTKEKQCRSRPVQHTRWSAVPDSMAVSHS